MSSQSGFGEELIGTDTWIARVLGKFYKSDIEVESIGEVRLHPEIQRDAEDLWQNTLDMRRTTLLLKAEKEGRKIDVYTKDEKPLPALYIKEGEKESRILFCGPSIALIKYGITDGKLKVVHGLTNYAVRTLMNTRPYQIIDKYGHHHFVDSVNLSVLPTFLDENLGEVGQTFRRHGINVNEYPGAIGTIAGGFASTNPKTNLTLMNPFHAIEKEMYAEGRLLPWIATNEYFNRGIIPLDSEIEFDEMADGTKTIYVLRKGQPRIRAVVYDEDDLVCTGIATDINPFAKDPSGSIKQFLKSEYMFLCRTKIPRRYYDEKDEINIQKGWPINDEHVEAYYFPFTEKGISEYVKRFHPELMGCSSAVIAYSLADFENGKGMVAELAREIGKHPFYSRIDSKIPILV